MQNLNGVSLVVDLASLGMLTANINRLLPNLTNLKLKLVDSLSNSTVNCNDYLLPPVLFPKELKSVHVEFRCSMELVFWCSSFLAYHLRQLQNHRDTDNLANFTAHLRPTSKNLLLKINETACRFFTDIVVTVGGWANPPSDSSADLLTIIGKMSLLRKAELRIDVALAPTFIVDFLEQLKGHEVPLRAKTVKILSGSQFI